MAEVFDDPARWQTSAKFSDTKTDDFVVANRHIAPSGQHISKDNTPVKPKSTGKTLPWPTVRGAIEGALRVGLVELAVDSGPWPCDYGAAQMVRLRLKGGVEIPPLPLPPPLGQLSAEADLSAAQIQDLADAIGELASAAAGYYWGVRVRIELGDEKRPPDDVVEKVSKVLLGVSKDLDLE